MHNIIIHLGNCGMLPAFNPCQRVSIWLDRNVETVHFFCSRSCWSIRFYLARFTFGLGISGRKPRVASVKFPFLFLKILDSNPAKQTADLYRVRWSWAVTIYNFCSAYFLFKKHIVGKMLENGPFSNISPQDAPEIKSRLDKNATF